MLKILFQGDSITDGNRGRNDDPNHIYGHGFVFIIAARLRLENPELIFMNRGVSGNRLIDIYARWEEDSLELQPDITNLLLGINDVQSNTPPERFDKLYRMLIKESPDTNYVICEPFILKTGKYASDWNKWRNKTKKIQEICLNITKEFNLPYIPFQKIFDNACKKFPVEHWSWDGIHPTEAGHQLMADSWLEKMKKDLTT